MKNITKQNLGDILITKMMLLHDVQLFTIIYQCHVNNFFLLVPLRMSFRTANQKVTESVVDR